MIDVKPFIARLLGGVVDVELSFPRLAEELPVITITETGNDAAVILGGKDRYSVITLQLDVFAGDALTVTTLAGQVNSRLTELGMKRSFSQLLTDGKFPRMCMRYRFGVDEATGRVVTV